MANLPSPCRFCGISNAIKIERPFYFGEQLSNGRQNESELLLILGQLGEAEAAAREALAYALESEAMQLDADFSDFVDKSDVNRAAATRHSLCYLADALTQQGRTAEALAPFNAANAIERSVAPDGRELYSNRGVRWTKLLIRLGQRDRAQAITEANLRISEYNGWGDDIAGCQALLGALASASDRFSDAAPALAAAVSVLRSAHQIMDLPWVLLVEADLERRQCQWEVALGIVEAALRLAAPRGMRLGHADALVLRARIRLDRAQATRAATPRADAEHAGDYLDRRPNHCERLRLRLGRT